MLTFSDSLVLRSEAVFLSQTFHGGIEVPTGASATIIRSSISFAAHISSGITIREDSSLLLVATTLMAETRQMDMVQVNDGAHFVVESCMIQVSAGSSDPLPCDGVFPNCDSIHSGAVELAGWVATVSYTHLTLPTIYSV